MSRMDQKLHNILSGNYTRNDFMIADAKDGDMGGGVRMAGPRRRKDGTIDGYRTRREYLDSIKAVVAQDIVDIMLVSASNLEVLNEEGTFRNSLVKPAIRANETTDIWGGLRSENYASAMSIPHSSAVLPRIMHGKTTAIPDAPVTGTDLGLYSMTINNNLTADLASLEAYIAFRAEAGQIGFQHFLEVFNPNTATGLDQNDIGFLLNDHIVRCLAGVMKADRPLFLKIPFNSPAAIEELATFDPTLVVGVLGGSAGTTRDTFELVHQAERYGARLALFGRKINLAEQPLTLIELMRQVVDQAVAPKEAVRAYHAALQTSGITPMRPLEDDLKITESALQHERS